jgi:hypothetical protein
MDNTKGNIVYIYALLDEDDNITYIGKSSSPKTRLYNHANFLTTNNPRAKILDYFYDSEDYWIKKILNEGHPLQNKEIDISNENWNIGDIISISKREDRKIVNTLTGTTYKSINDASVKIDISSFIIKSILTKPNHPLKELYNLEYFN